MNIRRILFALLVLALSELAALGQADGKLQIHYMDVGQGDGEVLVSPRGQVVMFDDGAAKNCGKPVSYLQQLGVNKIDYHIASHYHSDHIGCATQVFKEIALPTVILDRGADYPSTVYRNYAMLAGASRKTATPGMEITLDEGSTDPVRIKVVALNGNGTQTTNENDLSLVAVVSFGNFKTEFGGDLSGFDTANYKDRREGIAILTGINPPCSGFLDDRPPLPPCIHHLREG